MANVVTHVINTHSYTFHINVIKSINKFFGYHRSSRLAQTIILDELRKRGMTPRSIMVLAKSEYSIVHRICETSFEIRQATRDYKTHLLVHMSTGRYHRLQVRYCLKELEERLQLPNVRH